MPVTYGTDILSLPDGTTVLITSNGLLLGNEQTVNAEPAGRLVRDSWDCDEWGRIMRGNNIRRSG